MPVRAAATRTDRSIHAADASPAADQGTLLAARRLRRRGRGRAEVVHPPLGSLTQRDDRVHAWCQACGSAHITRLSMHLTDGTPVDFTSCHRCEYRTWEHQDGRLTVDGVLDRTRKPG
jgi:DNA-binding LacI/PurR family transcriptional regulator